MGKYLIAVVMLAAVVPAQAQIPRAEADQIRARQRLATLESVLERAVMNGADILLRQMEPDSAMLTGQPQVRGFRLEGYGVFFDVEVPALRISIAWMVKSAARSGPQVASSALADLKSMIARMPPGDRERMAGAVQRLELALSATAPMASPVTALRSDDASPSAAALADGPLEMSNPNDAWTREVKAALIEAMLEHSNALEVGDNEWLTVAARDNVPNDPRVPGGSTDFSTVILRVKGSDLAALHARKITLDEARTRVEVKEF